MRQTVRLPSQTFVTGGQLQFPTSGLEPHKRLIGILLRFPALITQATSAAINGRALVGVFESIRLGDYVNSTGVAIRQLNNVMTGKYGDAPAGVLITDGAYRRMIQCWIPFEDNGHAPQDACPRTEHVRDTPLTVKMATVATLFHAGCTVAGTVEALAVVEDINVNVMPAQSEIHYVDGGQSLEINVGGGKLFTELFLYEEATNTAITSLTVVDVSLRADGREVYSKLSIGELNAMFNYKQAEGGALHAESVTAPVQGESLTDEPAVADASAATITVTGEAVPLYFAGDGYKATKHGLVAARSLRVDITGTDTTIRIAWRCRRAHSMASLNSMRAKSGLPGQFAPINGGKNVSPKTASKVALNGRDRAQFAQFLPVRLLAA